MIDDLDLETNIIKVKWVELNLPGRNCKRCGFASCKLMAYAIVNAQVSPSVCPKLPKTQAAKIAEMI